MTSIILIMTISLKPPNCFGQEYSNKWKIFKDESCQFCDKTVKKGYRGNLIITSR